MAVQEKVGCIRTELPPDILYTILLTLPVKSLQRFKAVCKSWNDMISDHDFVKRHLQQSRSSGNQNILVWDPDKFGSEEFSFLKFEKNKFHVVETIQERHWDRVLCSSPDDGLLLLSIESCSTSYMLWNPSSKQQALIPNPGIPLYEKHWTSFGFCRCPTSDDYKIVARYGGHYVVYSCKNKIWTEKKEFPYSDFNRLGKGVFINGFSFFSMIDISFNNHNLWEIIYFDPRDDTFSKLEKPRKLKDYNIFWLISLRGCLCLYDRVSRIWITRDPINVESISWTEFMISEPAGILALFPKFLTEKNELVMLSRDKEKTEFGIYNSTENKYRKVDCPTSGVFPNCAIVPFVDSLFFPIRS